MLYAEKYEYNCVGSFVRNFSYYFLCSFWTCDLVQPCTISAHHHPMVSIYISDASINMYRIHIVRSMLHVRWERVRKFSNSFPIGVWFGACSIRFSAHLTFACKFITSKYECSFLFVFLHTIPGKIDSFLKEVWSLRQIANLRSSKKDIRIKVCGGSGKRIGLIYLYLNSIGELSSRNSVRFERMENRMEWMRRTIYVNAEMLDTDTHIPGVPFAISSHQIYRQIVTAASYRLCCSPTKRLACC